MSNPNIKKNRTHISKRLRTNQMSNPNIKKNRTHISKRLRNNYGINSRVTANGDPIPYKVLCDEDNLVESIAYLPTKTDPEDNITPFNILCNCDGACAVKQIIMDGSDMVVLFADGDRVTVTRHTDDKDDPVTALLWALGKKVFGEKISVQINKALKRRAVKIEQLRKDKKVRKDLAAMKKSKLVQPING